MQLRQRIALFLFSINMALAAAAPAPSHPEYRVTVVGPANSVASDINQAGTVVGYYQTGVSTTRAFLNRGAGMVNLGGPDSTSSTAVAINDKGQVLGNRSTAGGERRGFVYYQGTQRDLAGIAGVPTGFMDINNAGYITAGAYIDPPGNQHVYLRAPDGSLRDIGALPAAVRPSTVGGALNNRNQIAGGSGPLTFPEQPYRAILWDKGVMRDLGDFGWAPNIGNAINDRGQVAGYATLPVGLHNQVAFLYSHGRMINIDGRPVFQGMFSGATGINNLGYVVGFSDHLSGFIYRGRRMESLNALIDPGQGWDIHNPQAINDAGQIAATGWRGGVTYALRLDLIRPCLETAPALAPDEQAAFGAAGRSPEAAAAQARAEAEAQPREVALPVRQ
jgi:probable HAF family extracellular repeat protein